MYKTDYKNMKTTCNFLVVATVIFCIVYGYIFAFRGPIRKLSMDSEVVAYDVEIKKRTSDDITTYQPTYHYKVDGKEYIYTVPISSVDASNMRSQKMIYYKSLEPDKCVSEYEVTIGPIKVVMMLVLLPIVYIVIKYNLKVKKKIKKLKWLEQNGTLIKNLKYELVPVKNKNSELMAIQVDYELSSGEIIKLTGEPKYDKNTYNANDFVDLLIDINNIDNYYINFNIECDS